MRTRRDASSHYRAMGKNNRLIYGERQQQFDAIFKAQLDQWNQDKILTYLDLVYSRDSNQIKYVQDLLMNKQEQLKSWIDNGAMIYICGSLKGMAENVDKTLTNILGINKVNQLKSKKYYMRDVY